MYDLYDEINKALEALKTGGLKSKDRLAYDKQVAELSSYRDQLREMGLDDEAIAHILYSKRKALAAHYQEKTPYLIQQYIQHEVHEKHSNLGMTFDELEAQESYDEMIESLITTHGNLDQWVTLDHFKTWLNQLLHQ